MFARWNSEPKFCAVNILTKRNCKCYESFIIVAITEEIMSALGSTIDFSRYTRLHHPPPPPSQWKININMKHFNKLSILSSHHIVFELFPKSNLMCVKIFALRGGQSSKWKANKFGHQIFSNKCQTWFHQLESWVKSGNYFSNPLNLIL